MHTPPMKRSYTPIAAMQSAFLLAHTTDRMPLVRLAQIDSRCNGILNQLAYHVLDTESLQVLDTWKPSVQWHLRPVTYSGGGCQLSKHPS